MEFELFRRASGKENTSGKYRVQMRREVREHQSYSSVSRVTEKTIPGASQLRMKNEAEAIICKIGVDTA